MNAYQSQSIRRKIRGWYHRHAPRLPWRKTTNPYHIFISEVMLQQTQISRVLEKYPQFLEKFPTIGSLASSSLADVLAVWHGMGYNRRALYLKRAAETIVKEHKSCIPKTEPELRALPGIGPYCARAVLCFAYGKCKPFIETNIRRALIHECFPDQQQVSDADILTVLTELQPRTNTRAWYYALMDYGRDALRTIQNPNRNSKQYTKQSKFEGSRRYIRAKIISYLLENKKATEEEFFASLKKDKHLTKLVESDVHHALTSLKKEKLIKQSGSFFLIT